MKALIVDDEPLARAEVRRLLSQIAGIEVVGECSTVAQAKEVLTRLTPDVLLLDIEMPGGSGFDLLEQLESVPAVIFTTAYDRHAVRAFDVGAVDYVLKPIEVGRLAAALARVAPQQTRSRVFVRDGARCWLVPFDEVSRITSDGNYVRLSWGERELLFARSLATLERHLGTSALVGSNHNSHQTGVGASSPRSEPSFFRANRAELVNLSFITEVTPAAGGRLTLLLRGGVTVQVSRRQARALRATLGW